MQHGRLGIHIVNQWTFFVSAAVLIAVLTVFQGSSDSESESPKRKNSRAKKKE